MGPSSFVTFSIRIPDYPSRNTYAVLRIPKDSFKLDIGRVITVLEQIIYGSGDASFIIPFNWDFYFADNEHLAIQPIPKKSFWQKLVEWL